MCRFTSDNIHDNFVFVAVREFKLTAVLIALETVSSEAVYIPQYGQSTSTMRLVSVNDNFPPCGPDRLVNVDIKQYSGLI